LSILSLQLPAPHRGGRLRLVSRRPFFGGIAWTILAGFWLGLSPQLTWACACGCGVFEVGTSGMMPTGEGGVAYLEWDGMDQNQNWSGGHAASAANNGDKDIRTDFYRVGLQYMFNREWGLHAQVPYWDRTFSTTDDKGSIVKTQYSGVGDIRLEGVYTGFSPDMSTGLTFGLKLPTGAYTFNPNPGLYPGNSNPVDRDTQIGSGSTDLLLGAFHVGGISADNAWGWFTQGMVDAPMTGQNGYYPGSELDVALGTYYDFGSLGFLGKLSPVLTLKGSNRMADAGPNATVDANGNPQSGYTRILVAPGLEADVGPVRIYAEVAVPVYQFVNGNQLVADTLYKVLVGYTF